MNAWETAIPQDVNGNFVRRTGKGKERQGEMAGLIEIDAVEISEFQEATFH